MKKEKPVSKLYDAIGPFTTASHSTGKRLTNSAKSATRASCAWIVERYKSKRSCQRWRTWKRCAAYTTLKNCLS